MENVASFLQYGCSPYVGQLCNEAALKRWEPTAEELKAKEDAEKKQRAKDQALCTISTAEKLMLTGLGVEESFERAEMFLEKAKSLLAERVESN